MKIRILPSGERDLEEIYDYLAADSPAYAEEFLNRFDASLTKLQKFPRAGKMTVIYGLKSSGYRYIKTGRYYTYYRIEENIIYIYRIIHTSRDQNKTLK